MHQRCCKSSYNHWQFARPRRPDVPFQFKCQHWLSCGTNNTPSPAMQGVNQKSLPPLCCHAFRHQPLCLLGRESCLQQIQCSAGACSRLVPPHSLPYKRCRVVLNLSSTLPVCITLQQLLCYLQGCKLLPWLDQNMGTMLISTAAVVCLWQQQSLKRCAALGCPVQAHSNHAAAACLWPGVPCDGV